MKINERSSVWIAVVNVFAASKKAASMWEKAEIMLKDQNVRFRSRKTGRAGNAMELTFDACVSGYRKFIAVGGDGTVHDVLNGIASFIEWKEDSGDKVLFSDFTISVLPLGSGNDWIKSSGIPNNIEKAIGLIASESYARQDVVRVSVLDPIDPECKRQLAVSYMMNVGGIGIDARVCERVNAAKARGKRGKKLYVSALLHAIRNRVPAFARVVCDGECVFDGAYLSMAFGVGKYSGGGMRQTPAAVLDDGLLDMTIIPDLPLMRIAREVPRLFTGSFLKVPELIVSKSRTIKVYPYGASVHEPVEVDGEVVGRAPVCFEVLDSQINIVCGS